MSKPRIAVVGTGIAGMGAAWLLAPHCRLRVFEADQRPGGHSNTVRVAAPGGPVDIDTGFIVFNPVNYPNLSALLRILGVESQATEMSFAVSVDDGALEYSGTSLAGLFNQRRNLLRPGFHRMLVDILRFNRAARRLARNGDADSRGSLGNFLDSLGLGAAIREHYLLPMTAAIWSCSARTMLSFPAHSMVRFLDNHGLLNINNRPQWHTVLGGSRRYVTRLCAGFMDRVRLGCAVTAIAPCADGVRLRTADGALETFDQVVIATHADQALALLQCPSEQEAALLSRFHYQPNKAVLHRDPALMPRRRGVWSAWNYLARPARGATDRVCVSYWMNALQGLACDEDYFVTLNPLTPPRPEAVICEQIYQHPIFDSAAIQAQSALHGIQGRRGLWFCGSYFGHGFHEDALRSGLQVAARLGVSPPWWGHTESAPCPSPVTASGLPALGEAARVATTVPA